MLSWISQNGRREKRAAIFVSVFFAAFFLLCAVCPALAQVQTQTDLDLGLAPVQESVGLGTDDIRLIIARIIRAVLGLLGIIAVSLVVYAGYVIMTSGGNEEKIAQGKKILINAVVGVVIILSSLAIVQFLINSLMQATGLVSDGGISKPKIETFSGSGALGDIVKDHYPQRNQTGVPRNTKIIITFAEPINAGSFIENTNQTCWPVDGSGKPAQIGADGGAKCLKDKKGKIVEYYGDCVVSGKDFDWEKHCDHLLIDNKLAKEGKEQNFHIYRSDEKTDNVPFKAPVAAAAMASYDAIGNAFTFVLRPFQPLGDDLQNVWYTVKLNNNVKKKDGLGAFDGLHYQYYQWQFQTDTVFDFAPPHIVSVYPWKDTSAPRNSIVQINFNEAMDPMMVQGVLGKDSGFTNIIFGLENLPGEWRVSNGYKTAEFVSDINCGQNSCGDDMYCLPVDCKPEDGSCKTEYAVLVRTAEQMPNTQTFEAVPFSGVMDVSGNALDGDNDNVYSSPPTKGENGNFKLIGPEERKKTAEGVVYPPDNYGWDFKIENKIDRAAPYVVDVEPELDAGGVGKTADVVIVFSKPMWLSSIGDIALKEYPPAVVDKKPVDFFFYTSSVVGEQGTVTTVKHREFGPNNTDYYYFPVIPNTVKSVNQNCFYPGRGPGGDKGAGEQSVCKVVKYTEDGVPVTAAGCVPVTLESEKDTGCVQTLEKSDGILIQVSSSTSTCLQYLTKPEVSPWQGPNNP